MQFNSFFFPIPKPQYSEKDLFDKLIYIEHLNRKVPCCIERRDSNLWLIYFHGNSQDLAGALQFMQSIKKASELNCNILVVEYPGYGIYKNYQPTEQIINQDAEAVYQYIERRRSMGTGPACHLASLNKAKGVILISAYASFKKIAKYYVKFLSFMVKDRFKNSTIAEKIEIPLLLIHGKMDTIIPYSHSQKIYDRAQSVLKNIHLPETMGHLNYDMIKDICEPIVEFIEASSGQMISSQIQQQL